MRCQKADLLVTRVLSHTSLHPSTHEFSGEFTHFPRFLSDYLNSLLLFCPSGQSEIYFLKKTKVRTADYTEIPELSRYFACLNADREARPCQQSCRDGLRMPAFQKIYPVKFRSSVIHFRKRSGSICCWRAWFSRASIEILRQNPSHSCCISSSRSEKDVSGLTSLTRTHGLCLRCSRQRSCARS